MENIRIESLLKQKQTVLQKVSSELESKLNEKNVLIGDIRVLQLRQQKIQNDIKELTNKSNLIVSEHAILRYIERVCGVDLEKVRDEILTKELMMMVQELGDGIFPIRSSIKAIVKNNVVVTIKTDGTK